MKAYPYQHKSPTSGLITESEGMDLRDYFASMAMQVEMSGNSIASREWRNEVARECYRMADAMLEARNANN